MIGIKVARFDILKSLEDYRGMLDRMGMASLWKWSRKSHGKALYQEVLVDHTLDRASELAAAETQNKIFYIELT